MIVHVFTRKQAWHTQLPTTGSSILQNTKCVNIIHNFTDVCKCWVRKVERTSVCVCVVTQCKVASRLQQMTALLHSLVAHNWPVAELPHPVTNWISQCTIPMPRVITWQAAVSVTVKSLLHTLTWHPVPGSRPMTQHDLSLHPQLQPHMHCVDVICMWEQTVVLKTGEEVNTCTSTNTSFLTCQCFPLIQPLSTLIASGKTSYSLICIRVRIIIILCLWSLKLSMRIVMLSLTVFAATIYVQCTSMKVLNKHSSDHNFSWHICGSTTYIGA